MQLAPKLLTAQSRFTNQRNENLQIEKKDSKRTTPNTKFFVLKKKNNF